MMLPIAKPSQRRLIREAGREGLQSGKTAQLVLTMRFQEEFLKPLSEVRAEYRITPTTIEALKYEIGCLDVLSRLFFKRRTKPPVKKVQIILIR